MSVLVLALLFAPARSIGTGRTSAGSSSRDRAEGEPPQEAATPSGRVRVGLIVLIVALAAGTGLALNAARTPRAGRRTAGRIAEVARLATGHQRAERPVFLDGGRLLAVDLPALHARRPRPRRPTRRASNSSATSSSRAGPSRPSARVDRLFVVVRPARRRPAHRRGLVRDVRLRRQADRLEGPGRLGPPTTSPSPTDGRYAYLLTSGHAEGETNRPPPALDRPRPERPGTTLPVGRVAFDLGQATTPSACSCCPDGKAAVSLRGSNQIARLDLSDPDSPKLLDRLDLPAPCVPDALAVGEDGRLLVGDPDASAFWRLEGDRFVQVDVDGGVAELVEAGGLVFATLPRGSGLAVLSAGSHAPLGKLSIRGAANLATTRPLGIASCPERKLIAVSNRAGGSIHLIAIE